MLGLMMNEMEQKEIEYMLKREMEELLLDLSDSRIDHIVKRAMEERYQILYNLYRRFVPEKESLKYIPPKRKYK